MSELLFLVPTRGRPENARELVSAWERTRKADSRLLFLIDDDDPRQMDYRVLDTAWPDWVDFEVGHRRPVAELVNHAATSHMDSCFALGFMGDDHRPRTEGWDEIMLEVFGEMKSGIVYANDDFQGINLPTSVAISSDIVRALGWFSPPGLCHMYMDNAWLALGEGLQRLAYLPDIHIEHMHPVAGKAEWDAGYKEVNDTAVYDHDREVLRRWLEQDFQADIARVKAAIEA